MSKDSHIVIMNQQHLELYSAFAEAAMLNKQHDPWRKRKPENMEMALFELVFESGNNWWYDKFVGVEFMGQILWDDWHFKLHGVKKIKEVRAVAMVKNVYINMGRTLSPDHLIMM